MMIKKLFIPILFALFFFESSKAQTFRKTDWGINATTDSLTIDIQFYSPSIVRIVKSPKDRSFTKESLSVIKSPEKTSFSISQKADVLILKTQSISVRVHLKTGNMAYNTVAGKNLLQEKEASSQFTPFNDAGNNTYSVLQAYYFRSG